MKIIFTKDVARVGQRGQIKEFADGYASHLLRTGVAEFATPQKIAEIQKTEKVAIAKKEKESLKLKGLVKKVNNAKIVLAEKANEHGHLFKAVGANEIVDAIQKSLGVELPSNFIKIDTPIKEIGKATVRLVGGEVVGEITIEVVASE